METINTYYEDYYKLLEFVEENRSTLFCPDNSAILVQVFSGRCDPAFLSSVSAEISRLTPHVHILGTTTSGEIMDGQVTGLKTVLSYSIFRHTTVACSAFPKNGQDDFELGRQIATKLGNDSARVLILFANGQSVNPEELLVGVQSVYPSLPVAGGNAGNNSLAAPSLLVCGSQIVGNGVVAASLQGDLQVHVHSHLGWQPIGKEMTVTKIIGRRVYTIDDIPAYQVYRKYLGLSETDKFINALEYPLLVKRHGILTARTPNRRYVDDSLGFVAELQEGEKVRFSFGDIGIISEAVVDLCQRIRQWPVESIFVYSCECRRGFLQELSKIETEPLQEIAPTAGFFTQGEFFHVGQTNQFFNATMTVLVLSESTRKDAGQPMCPNRHREPSKSALFYEDNVVKRNTGMLKALTHLVNTVTAELVNSNERLQFISLHDSLTGLYNRAFFEQEMKRLDALSGQVGVIVCDLDFLKLINDFFGHDVGDKTLREAAEVIAKACPVESIVSRIGGDEFAILLPNAEISLISTICDQITSEAANRRQRSPEKLLYISVGHSVKVGNKSMLEVFKLADKNMYRHKMADKGQVRQEIIHYLGETNGEY